MRLILPRVARNGGHYVPTTYAVWYEYLAGVNPALVAALDARLQKPEALAQPEIDRLFARHIDARDARALEQLQAGLTQMLHRVAQLLRTAAQSLQHAIKGRNLAVRFGGEEFLILLPDTPVEGARILAEQIRTAFSKMRIRRCGSDQLIDKATISLGVAAPAAGESLEQAIERADRALYQAKDAGRNCVRDANAAAMGKWRGSRRQNNGGSGAVL